MTKGHLSYGNEQQLVGQECGSSKRGRFQLNAFDVRWQLYKCRCESRQGGVLKSEWGVFRFKGTHASLVGISTNIGPMVVTGRQCRYRDKEAR